MDISIPHDLSENDIEEDGAATPRLGDSAQPQPDAAAAKDDDMNEDKKEDDPWQQDVQTEGEKRAAEPQEQKADVKKAKTLQRHSTQ